jgi:hypothetical protein
MPLPESVRLRVCEFLDVESPRMVYKWTGLIPPRRTFPTIDTLVESHNLESKRGELLEVQAKVRSILSSAVRVKVRVFALDSSLKELIFVRCPLTHLREPRLHLAARMCCDGSVPVGARMPDLKDFIFVDYTLFMLREWTCENPAVACGWPGLVPLVSMVFVLPAPLRQVLLESLPV